MSDAVNRISCFVRDMLKLKGEEMAQRFFFLNNFFKDHELKLISCSFDIICS